ncbi:hypothetical protein KKG65_03285 [Patescibacteria group bacterium]|nr:hypothetical protein [Patescibacteria group bacterium]
MKKWQWFLMAGGLFLLIILMAVNVCNIADTPEPTPTPVPFQSQFQWSGEVDIATSNLLEGILPNPYELEKQLPQECRSEYIMEIPNHSYRSGWYEWIHTTGEEFVFQTGDKEIQGVVINVKPVTTNGEITVVFAASGDKRLFQAVAHQILTSIHWGIIIQFDLPEPTELTGNLPLYTTVPVECWAGAYGGGY